MKRSGADLEPDLLRLRIDAFRANTELLVREEGALLWSRKTKSVYWLNLASTAAACVLHEHADADRAADALADMIKLDSEPAMRLIGDFVARLSETEERGVAAPALPPDWLSLINATPSCQTAPRRGHVAILDLAGHCCEFTVAASELEAQHRPVVDHLRAPAGSQPQLTLEIAERGAEYVFVLNGTAVDRCSRRTEVAPILNSLLFWIVVARSNYRIALHAAALQRDGTTVLMPGRAGEGKTTLTAKLISRGWDYVSDDCVLIDDDLRVQGVPTSLTIKESGLGLASADHPELLNQPVSVRRDGREVRYLSPPRLGRQGQPFTHLFFPRYASGRSDLAAMAPLRPADAAASLLPLATCPGELNKHWALQLISAVESRPAFLLQTRDLERSAACIEQAVRPMRRVPAPFPFDA
jgi:hypothetical protein